MSSAFGGGVLGVFSGGVLSCGGLLQLHSSPTKIVTQVRLIASQFTAI